MSDLNHHDEEEYHFDDSENFDFGEHDNTSEEEFIGDEDIIEEANAKGWENERAVAAPNKASTSTMKKKIVMGVGVVVLLIAGYYLMVPHGKVADTSTAIPAATENDNTAKPSSVAANTPVPNDSTAPAVTNNQPATTGVTNSSAADTDSNNAADDDDWLSGSSSSTTASPDNTTTPPNSTAPSSNNVSAATTAPAASESTSSDVPNDNSLQMQLQTLNTQNQTLTLKLQQVTAQSEAAAARAANLEKTVAQLQIQMNKMNQMLQGGTSTPNSPPPLTRTPVSARPVQAAAPASNKAVASTSNQSQSAVAYYVQAIIPGRAWIGDSNGRIVTVTQGDRLEALNSTVKDIDPINGVVTLSNGRQIEYGMVAQ